jgi:hypothetical protein
MEYLCDHFGGDRLNLIPKRYVAGKAEQVGGETEEWMRYRYYMHYTEGSFMPFLVMQLVMDSEFLFLWCFVEVMEMMADTAQASGTPPSRSSSSR